MSELDSVLWPDPDRGPWVISAAFGTVNGRAECVGVEIRSYREPWRKGDVDQWLDGILPIRSGPDTALNEQEPKPLTAHVWRSVPIMTIVGQLRQTWADVALKRQPAARRRTWDATRPRQRRVTLGQVASVYNEAFQSGDASPNLAVVKRFPELTYKAAKRRVERARQEGLIPATTRGRARGSNTEGDVT